MALVRILIDGYSLLHNFPELAPGKPRHSAAARHELLYWLTQYQDTIGTPITVVFDGGGAPIGTPKPDSSRQLEVLYSKAGQTADQIIERVAYRLGDYGEVLVVTDDFAERDTVLSVGGAISSCANFISTVESTLRDLGKEVQRHNEQERKRFKNAGNR